MRHPLYVAFVWHMHQPSYLDEGTSEMVLPWVRLHATKDYLHMVEVLEDYPDVHATFNIVPSMVEQLQGYADGTVRDRAWDVSMQADLSVEELAESGQTYEAELLEGVEEAADHPEQPVHTREDQERSPELAPVRKSE